VQAKIVKIKEKHKKRPSEEIEAHQAVKKGKQLGAQEEGLALSAPEENRDDHTVVRGSDLF
jgi:hypothetical protein